MSSIQQRVYVTRQLGKAIKTENLINQSLPQWASCTPPQFSLLTLLNIIQMVYEIKKTEKHGQWRIVSLFGYLYVDIVNENKYKNIQI